MADKRPSPLNHHHHSPPSKKLKPPPETTAPPPHSPETTDDIFAGLEEMFAGEPPDVRVRFVPYPYNNLLKSPVPSSYVTINGNEESCGSSFSEGDSSFMASFDTRNLTAVCHGGAWVEAVAREGEGWDEVLVDLGFLDEAVFGSPLKKEK